jgi:hypothetical protein
MHVDTVNTHVVSAIINVDQQVEKDWPLLILDHEVGARSVVSFMAAALLRRSLSRISKLCAFSSSLQGAVIAPCCAKPLFRRAAQQSEGGAAVLCCGVLLIARSF